MMLAAAGFGIDAVLTKIGGDIGVVDRVKPSCRSSAALMGMEIPAKEVSAGGVGRTDDVAAPAVVAAVDVFLMAFTC